MYVPGYNLTELMFVTFDKFLLKMSNSELLPLVAWPFLLLGNCRLMSALLFGTVRSVRSFQNVELLSRGENYLENFC